MIKYLKAGTRFDIPEAVFYDSSSPPQAIITRPVSIWADSAGDLIHVLEAYGTEQYSQLYAVRVVPRYPGAQKQIKFEMELSECRRLEDFRGASSSSSSPRQPTASTAATGITGSVPTADSPSPSGMHSDPPPDPPAPPPRQGPGPISPGPPARSDIPSDEQGAKPCPHMWVENWQVDGRIYGRCKDCSKELSWSDGRWQ